MNTKNDTTSYMTLNQANIERGMKVEEEDNMGNVVGEWKVLGKHRPMQPAKHHPLSSYPHLSRGWVLGSRSGALRLIFPEDMAETPYFVLE